MRVAVSSDDKKPGGVRHWLGGTSLGGDLALFALFGLLGTAASYLSINIPYTQVYIEGRSVFALMGFALLRRWWLAAALAVVISKPIGDQIPFHIAFFGNLAYYLPDMLLVRLVHGRWLNRLKNVVWYGLGWAVLVLALYQLLHTPIIWLVLESVLDDLAPWQALVNGWLGQPFLFESIAVALFSALAMMVLRNHGELWRNRRELAITLDSIGDAVIATDAQARITRMNPVAERLTGWSRHEAIGRSIHEVFRIINAQTRQPATCPVERAIREGVVVGLANHTCLLSKDGGEYQIADSAAPLYEADGRLIGAVMVFRDVTSEYASRIQAREAQLKQQEAVRAANVGLWDWDLRTDKVQYSPEWKRQVGYEEHEIGDGLEEWRKRVHPDDIDQAMEKVSQAKADAAQHYSVEFRLQHKDGSYRWILAQGSVICDDDGQPIRIVGSHVDITERKQFEQALRSSEQKYRALMMQFPDCLLLHDLEGHIVEVNPCACRTYGYSREQLLGMNVADLDPDYQQREDHGRFWDEIRSGGLAVFEARQVTQDGRVFPVEVRLSLVEINGAEHVLGLCRDITQRKRDEQLRNLMISELDHRVKNNLTSVVSLVEMARSGSEPADSDAFDTLIGRIRAMARAHEALARHHWRGVDAHEVARAIVGGLAEGQLAIHGDTVTIPAPAAGPIAMVLHELATNAVKYGALSTPQGKVDLHIDFQDHAMQLTWTETQGPAVQPPQRTGQGTLLMRGFIEHELSGSINLDYQQTGLICRIEVVFDPIDIASDARADRLIRPTIG